MKKIKLLVLVTAFLLTLTAIPSYAGSGQALIPSLRAVYVNSTQYFRTLVNVTNITDNELSGTIKFYNTNGSLFYDDNSATGGNIQSQYFDTYSESVGSGTTSVSFTLNAHSTGSVTMSMKSNSSTWFEGYAVIEWDNVEGDDVYGLVAHGHCNYRIVGTNSMENSYSIPVNTGMPF